MKRWRWRENLKDMIESDRGEWVRFEDHAAEVHRLNNELTKLTLELAALKREKPEVQRCGTFHPYAQRICELAKGHEGLHGHDMNSPTRCMWPQS
jgi:hypothetical protein